jgi:hypothetical protein
MRQRLVGKAIIQLYTEQRDSKVLIIEQFDDQLDRHVARLGNNFSFRYRDKATSSDSEHTDTQVTTVVDLIRCTIHHML